MSTRAKWPKARKSFIYRKPRSDDERGCAKIGSVGVYHTEFIRSSLEIRISVREVETLASFFHRFCVHPHRAFPCCALQRTAGFPKYEALRGFDWARFVAREALRTRRPRHGEALPMVAVLLFGDTL